MEDKFTCPKCGADAGLFKVSGEPRPNDDFSNVTCACGHRFDGDEVKRQLGRIADKLMKDVLRKGG